MSRLIGNGWFTGDKYRQLCFNNAIMARFNTDKKPQRIDCVGCVHFQVTWDPQHPRACRAMGFKSKHWPCLEVLNTSGERCLLHKPRSGTDKRKKINANESDEPTPPGRFSRHV